MIKELTVQNYKELVEDSNKILFIDFYSPYCGPCQQLLPFLKTLDKHFENENVQILKCNTSKETKIAEKYLIQSVPTTLIVDLNKKIKSPELGLKDPSYYVNSIQKELNKQLSLLDKLKKIIFFYSHIKK